MIHFGEVSIISVIFFYLKNINAIKIQMYCSFNKYNNFLPIESDLYTDTILMFQNDSYKLIYKKTESILIIIVSKYGTIHLYIIVYILLQELSITD